MAAKTKKQSKPKTKPPLPPQEQEALQRYVEKEKAPHLKIELNEEGAMVVATSHDDDAIGHVLLLEAVGGEDIQFLNGLIRQIIEAGISDRNPGADDVNFLLSVIKGLRPQNQQEAMLAAQMGAIHMASMTMARRLAHATLIDQQDSAARALTKLTRTYAAQMETLKRVRSKGEQKVTVEHVHVHEGGQAIVGTVATPGADAATGGGGVRQSGGQPHATASPPHHADDALDPIDALTDGASAGETLEVDPERSR